MFQRMRIKTYVIGGPGAYSLANDRAGKTTAATAAIPYWFPDPLPDDMYLLKHERMLQPPQVPSVRPERKPYNSTKKSAEHPGKKPENGVPSMPSQSELCYKPTRKC